MTHWLSPPGRGWGGGGGGRVAVGGEGRVDGRGGRTRGGGWAGSRDSDEERCGHHVVLRSYRAGRMQLISAN